MTKTHGRKVDDFTAEYKTIKNCVCNKEVAPPTGEVWLKMGFKLGFKPAGDDGSEVVDLGWGERNF
jgi:hypothetical protein